MCSCLELILSNQAVLEFTEICLPSARIKGGHPHHCPAETVCFKCACVSKYTAILFYFFFSVVFLDCMAFISSSPFGIKVYSYL